MQKDSQILKEEISKMQGNWERSQNVLMGKEDSMKNEIMRISHEYGRYRENSQREIASLKQYINELKKQYDLLVRSEDKIKNNELKYKEMINKQNSILKSNAAIDHLWQVK